MNAGTPSRSAPRARWLLPALAAGLALAMCGAGLALASPALAAPGAGPAWQAQASRIAGQQGRPPLIAAWSCAGPHEGAA